MTRSGKYSRRQLGWLGLLIVIGVMLQACSDQATPSAPQPTTSRTANTAVSNPTGQAGPAITAVPVPTATPVPPTATPVPKPAQPLYLMLVMDYHQGNAGQIYYALPDQLAKQPDLKLTASFSGSTLAQLDQNQGPSNQPAQYAQLLVKNAATLTNDDKLFMLSHFFEVSPAQQARFPRYLDLKRKLGNTTDATSLAKIVPTWRETDWRDLQVVYLLAQLPPEMIQTEPVRSIVTRLVGFSEQDKTILLNLEAKQGEQAIDKYQKLTQSGQLELAAAPYAYPIAPLLADTNSAANLIDSKASLPVPAYSYPADIAAQLRLSQDAVKTYFGNAPVGALPALGALSEGSTGTFFNTGANWLLSDEGVLASSLGFAKFERASDSNEVVQKADQLYQAYQYSASGKTGAIFFADRALSNRLANGYSGKPADQAAGDFIKRVKAVRDELRNEKVADGEPRVITLVLDGTSAFSGYQDGGQALLAELTKQLANDNSIKLTTPGAYLKDHPATTKLDKLATGSAATSFDGWIGQPVANKGWTVLGQARVALDPYLQGTKNTDADKLAKASQWLYQAEAASVFEGLSSADSQVAAQADRTLRTNLSNAFDALGLTPPDYLSLPLAPLIAKAPSRAVNDLISPTIDGNIRQNDWADAGLYLEKNAQAVTSTEEITPTVTGGDTSTISNTNQYLTATYFGWDSKNIYLRIASSQPWSAIDNQPAIGLYFSSPHTKGESALNYYSQAISGSRSALGFGAGYQVQVQIDARRSSATASLYRATGSESWQIVQKGIEPVYAVGQNMEIALPWSMITNLGSGDKVYFTALLSRGNTLLQQVPGAGAGVLEAPDGVDTTPVLSVTDKTGDDDGTGDYVYPVDSTLYKPGSFDLTGFSVSKDLDKNLVLKLKIAGTLDNPLQAPQGFSLQTFDVYIHDPNSTLPTSRILLPGRNARVGTNDAWQYAIIAEGWEPAVYRVSKQGQPVKTDIPLDLQVSPDRHTLTVKLALSDLDDTDAENWAYLPAVLGTEQDPSYNVLRVKDVEVSATTDKFGGASTNPVDGNHTRIIDTIVPPGYSSQEILLNNYRSVSESDPAKLNEYNLPLLYMLRGSANRR